MAGYIVAHNLHVNEETTTRGNIITKEYGIRWGSGSQFMHGVMDNVISHRQEKQQVVVLHEALHNKWGVFP